MGVMNGTQRVKVLLVSGDVDGDDEGQIESSEVFEFQILFRTLGVTTEQLAGTGRPEGAKL